LRSTHRAHTRSKPRRRPQGASRRNKNQDGDTESTAHFSRYCSPFLCRPYYRQSHFPGVLCHRNSLGRHQRGYVPLYAFDRGPGREADVEKGSTSANRPQPTSISSDTGINERVNVAASWCRPTSSCLVAKVANTDLRVKTAGWLRIVVQA
jgi:hypothetical protein